MRYNSDLLYRLARAVDTSRLDGTEQDLELPSFLLPTIQVPASLPNLAGFDGTVTQRDSFLTQQAPGQVASTAARNVTVATVGRGFWEFIIHVAMLANFTQASDGSVVEGALMLTDPAAGNVRLCKLYAVNGVPQFWTQKLRLLFSTQDWIFRLNIPATGVGQTLEMSGSILGNRLL